VEAPFPLAALEVQERFSPAVEVRGELDVEKVLPKQAADGTVTLPAPMADIHDVGGGSMPQVESKDGKPSIGFWLDARDWVSWEFKIVKPGRFDVVATIACPAAGSKFEVAVGGEKWTAEAPNTGSYEDFKTVKLGTVEVSRKGPCELSIKPVRNQWQAEPKGPLRVEHQTRPQSMASHEPRRHRSQARRLIRPWEILARWPPGSRWQDKIGFV